MRASIKYIFICMNVLFFIILAAPVASGETDSFDAHENMVINSFYRGDYYKLYDTIESLLLKFPEKPEAYTYYFDLLRLKGVYGCKRVSNSLQRIIEILKNKKGFEKKNQCILTLKLELEELLYHCNRKQAEKLSGEIYPVRDWIVIGPYFRYGRADLDFAFLPEITTRLDDRNLKKKRIVLKDARGELDLKKHTYPDYEVAYAVTTLRAVKPLKLRIYSDASYKLFVNGREILKNIRGDVFRRYRVIKIWGTEYLTLMMKLSKGDSWSFRVIVTDENDNVVKPVIQSHKMVFSDFNFFEELDYPFAQFVEKSRNDPSRGFFLLGNYFDELDSKEAISYYKRSIGYGHDPLKQFFLASGMIQYSYGDRDSELFMEGWRIIEQLADDDTGFIPVQHKRFKKLIQRKNYRKAYFEGRKLIKRSRYYFPLRLDFVHLLLKLGYEKEFEEEIKELIRDFPDSIIPLRFFASYYRERNVRESIELYKMIIKRTYDKSSLAALIEIFRQQGAYDSAIRLIKERDFDGDFTKHLIEILIEQGNYKRARTIIFKEIVRNHDPYYYFKLGMISYMRNFDPSMYWEKLISIKPSYFNIGDFLNYTRIKRVINPFEKYRDYNITGRFINYLFHESRGDGAEILVRSRVYLLHTDGSSRAFFEDIIHLRDQQSVDKWGEYRVPSRGRMYPVRVRVYHKEGDFSDSYRIEKINGNYYINISSLKVGSIVHIAYYLDFPITEPRNSNFFSSPFMIIQDFDEPVSYFILKVIAPKDKVVDFCFNRDLEIKREDLNDKIIYRGEFENLKPIQREAISGIRLNHLPFVAFSTMRSIKDFIIWYNGLLRGVFEIDHSRVERFRGDDVRDVVVKVYDFVSREIDLLTNVLYFPEKAQNTLFKKSGSTEDKVILAKSILNSMGIKSYIAFARDGDLPDVGSFISPDIFSKILLYIPLDRQNEIWMDFSNQYYRCGVVDENVVGTEAVILVRNDYEIKEIIDSTVNKKSGVYVVAVDKLGNAQLKIELRFQGRSGTVRKLFRNKIYLEDEINRYIGSIIPSISIDEFGIENQGNYDKQFIIRVKGENYSQVTIGKDMLIFQPVINRSEIYEYIRYIKRELPLLIEKSIDEDEEYVYTLPSDFSGTEFNISDRVESSYGIALMRLKKIKGSRDLIVHKVIKIKKGWITPDEYSDFLNFCMKIKNMENKNVIMRR
jgi:hypothetical protein